MKCDNCPHNAHIGWCPANPHGDPCSCFAKDWVHPQDPGYPHEEVMQQNKPSEFINEQRILLTHSQFEAVVEDAMAEGRAQVNGGVLTSLFLVIFGACVGFAIGAILF